MQVTLCFSETLLRTSGDSWLDCLTFKLLNFRPSQEQWNLGLKNLRESIKRHKKKIQLFHIKLCHSEGEWWENIYKNLLFSRKKKKRKILLLKGYLHCKTMFTVLICINLHKDEFVDDLHFWFKNPSKITYLISINLKIFIYEQIYE